MTAREHYDNHLGNFYSWMTGNFDEKQAEAESFFQSNNIVSASPGVAIDLGCGHGIQSVSLAHLGFTVKAVDFNKQLADELRSRKKHLTIEVIEDDILHYMSTTTTDPWLVVCMGDTLTHLESFDRVELLIRKIAERLNPSGKVVLSFRDLTYELTHEQRFLHVKSDSGRILTCFLEYFPDFVMVHDILHEKQNGEWKQKVSTYPKLRINEKMITEMLERNGIRKITSQTINRMIYVIGQKDANC